MSIENRLHHLEKQYTELLSKLSDVQSCVDELIKNRDNLHSEIKQAEIKVNQLSQHHRSRSIEICNIPESVKSNQLREYVIELCKDINVTISDWSIAAVYRVGKRSVNKPGNVVVSFVNRRYTFLTRRNRRLLATVKDQKYKKLFIIENLCPLNKQIFNRLYKLQKQGSVNKVWTYGGEVYMKLAERGERIKVSHPDDIDNLIHPESPPLIHESQTYDNNESKQEEKAATYDKLPQKAKLSRDMTAMHTEDTTSKTSPPALDAPSRSVAITSTRLKSEHDIRMALNALFSEAVGDGPI